VSTYPSGFSRDESHSSEPSQSPLRFLPDPCWFTTISSSLPFIERFLKGLIEGVHFETWPEQSISDKEGELSQAQPAYVYHHLAPLLAPKLYPTMAAIANVYEEAKREDADAGRINPMELWDLHHIRRLDDTGFIDALYGQAAGRKPADPERIAELKKQQSDANDAIVRPSRKRVLRVPLRNWRERRDSNPRPSA
jgi:hypothetical protein